MFGNWQGPASFEAVLKEAAARAKEQDQKAEQIRQARHDDLMQLAAEIDIAMDRRRQRKSRGLSWDTFKAQIIEWHDQGVSDNEIANRLNEQGFPTSRREVYGYLKSHGIKQPKGEKKLRPSRLDDHADLIKDMIDNQKSLYQISLMLNQLGVSISPAAVGNYVRDREL